MINFLALGDSYTIGEGVAEDERWPVLLTAALRQHGLTVDEPVIIARTGWSVSELLAGMRDAGLSDFYDLITVQAGVNDQYRGHNIDAYISDFRLLLQQAIFLADGDAGKVLVLSIPDWGVTPFADGRDRGQIARQIDIFNSKNREEAEHSGIHYVDVTPASRLAAQDGALLTSDGLHPSAKMYAIWVDLILPVAQTILGAESMDGVYQNEI